jgi:hypothetical protein
MDFVIIELFGQRSTINYWDIEKIYFSKKPGKYY